MARARDGDYEDDDFDDRPPRRRRHRDDYDDGPPPPNYLAMSIIVTLFCCWAAGIPAIVYAAQVNTKWAVGDARGAYDASAKAKKWCWISFGGMIVVLILYIGLIALVATLEQ